MKEGLITELKAAQKFFSKSTECFEESDSDFSPNPELYSVAAHLQHVADTIEWFIEGGFGKGWDMDFEQHISESKSQKSLAASRKNLEAAFKHAQEVILNTSEKELMEPIPDKNIMDGAPRLTIVGAIAEHTAHHRGALTVYARLLGKVPPMPYS
jgi:uncharacterized damage-inducible protein DinB